MLDPADLLDQGEIAELLGVSESSFRSMRSQPSRHRRIDGLPAPLRTVGNTPVWDTVQVLLWWAASSPRLVVAPTGVPDWAEGRRATVVGVERGSRPVVVFEVDGRRLAQEWPHVQGWLRMQSADERPDWLRDI